MVKQQYLLSVLVLSFVRGMYYTTYDRHGNVKQEPIIQVVQVNRYILNIRASMIKSCWAASQRSERIQYRLITHIEGGGEGT